MTEYQRPKTPLAVTPPEIDATNKDIESLRFEMETIVSNCWVLSSSRRVCHTYSVVWQAKYVTHTGCGKQNMSHIQGVASKICHTYWVFEAKTNLNLTSDMQLKGISFLEENGYTREFETWSAKLL